MSAKSEEMAGAVDVNAALYDALCALVELDRKHEYDEEYAGLTLAVKEVAAILRAAFAVEAWWIERGVSNQIDSGAPAEIFALREALGRVKGAK